MKAMVEDTINRRKLQKNVFYHIYQKKNELLRKRQFFLARREVVVNEE